MPITDIPNISSLKTEWAAAQPPSRPAVASSSTATTETASVSSSTSAASAPSAQPGKSSGRVQVPSVATALSATVAGKNYAESVEESGGIYIASVPSPPGVRATGASVLSAENNLNMKLDELA
jgi:hypothetical protein